MKLPSIDIGVEAFMIVDPWQLGHPAVLLAMEQFTTLRALKLILLTALVSKYALLTSYFIKYHLL